MDFETIRYNRLKTRDNVIYDDILDPVREPLNTGGIKPVPIQDTINTGGIKPISATPKPLPIETVNIQDSPQQINGWQKPYIGFLKPIDNGILFYAQNRYNSVNKFFDVIPNEEITIKFEFENKSLVKPIFFIQEKIGDAWKTTSPYYDLKQSRAHKIKYTPKTNKIRVYFEKSEASDDGKLTGGAFKNFRLSQSNQVEVTPTPQQPNPSVPTNTDTPTVNNTNAETYKIGRFEVKKKHAIYGGIGIASVLAYTVYKSYKS